MVMRIVHTIAGLHPRSGGPPRTVSQLTDALADNETFGIVLLSQGLRGESIIPSYKSSLERQIMYSDSRLALALGLPLRKGIRGLLGLGRPALIHDHGIWLPSNHHVAATARRFGIPLLIHPRGMLQPWALGHRARKKHLAMHLYQRADLESAHLLLATSEAEAAAIRQAGFRQPLALIPNGIPSGLGEGGGGFERTGSPLKRNALCLSRMHPIKGVLNLVNAWADLAPWGWELRLAGPDEGGHLGEVLRLVKARDISSCVQYLGEVEGERKAQLFEEASLFILPSYSENFGVVVAEALSYGVPVIATRGTPWADLQTNDCGWWIDIGVEPLKDTLFKAMAMDGAKLQAMGAKGRVYVRRFNWAVIAGQTLDVYQWVLGRGPRPQCVVVD